MYLTNKERGLLPLSLKYGSSNPVIVIHSDDWGSIRMPSNEVRQSLHAKNGIFADSPYALYDSLASKKDLECLFETLSATKDSIGRPAILTANTIMSNPDFRRIRNSEFKEYYFKGIKETFSEYDNSEALEYWKQGMNEQVFRPQFHGREHVNVPFWLEKLQERHKGVIDAFNANVFGVEFSDLNLRKKNFQAAWDFNRKDQEDYLISATRNGYLAFTEYFGYKSLTAIAPSYTWSSNMEKMLREEGVRAMQSIIIHKVPNGRKNKYIRKQHFIYSSKYQIRTVFFEPSLTEPSFDNVGAAMVRVRAQISRGKPVFISSHRLNYIGVLNVSNRERSLAQLHKLLSTIKNEYPSVLFRSADELVQTKSKI